MQQQNIKVYYENQVVGDYFADIIADQVILEIKAAEDLREENKAFESETPNPCVSVESVSSVFHSF